MKLPARSRRATFLALAIAFVFVFVVVLTFPLPPLLASAAAQEGEAPQPPEGFELKGDPERVQPTYDKFCATCHGPEGKGDGVMAKFLDSPPRDLTDSEYMATRSDYQLYLAIKEGGAAVGLSDRMAPWKDMLPEQEIRDLTLLVRELGGDG